MSAAGEMISPVTELTKRHGAGHYANVKYGYIITFLCFVHMGYLYLSRRAYFKRWIKTGRSTSHNRLVSVPEMAFVIAWVLVLLGLSFYHFEADNIKSFYKRLGRLGYVLITLDVFVSLKPNPLPDVYYMELIFFHKWISRVIVLWTFVHSLGYTIVWLQADTFSKFFKLLNFLGVIAMSLFLISTLISLKPIRRRFYKTFFTTHLIIAWVCVFLIQFHARPGVTIYTFINTFLFILQIVTKIWKSHDVTVEKLTSSGSTLELIKLPNVFRDSTRWNAGSHVRLTYRKKNPLTYLLPSHPYTVASTPDETTIKLVIRKNAYNLRSHDVVSCFGPFPSIHNNFFKTAENVLLVAGGAGISYTLGIYQKLAENPSINVSMMWMIRNKSDLWILEHFRVRKIDIYITGGALTSDDPVSRLDEDEQLLGYDDHGDDFELEEFDPFDDVNLSTKPHKSYKLGRPNFNNYAPFITKDDKANNWIVSCGTGTLNADCKKWADGLGVRHHCEAYYM